MLTNEEKVAKVQCIGGYSFNNPLLCLEALQTSSLRLNWNGTLHVLKSNKRLALLGDSLLKTHLIKKWYHTDWLRSNRFLLSVRKSSDIV